LDNDQIIHLNAQQLFCFILERNAKQGVDLMQYTISRGPDETLRFLGEISNLVDHFREYLSECAKYGMCRSSDFECALRRFIDAQKKGEHLIKVGEWDCDV